MMDNIDVFNKWYDIHGEKLYAQQRLLDAGTFFLIQQAFIAGRKSMEKEKLQSDAFDLMKGGNCSCIFGSIDEMVNEPNEGNWGSIIVKNSCNFALDIVYANRCKKDTPCASAPAQN